MNKKELRNKIKSSLNDLTLDKYKQLSSNIKEKLLCESTINNSKTIAITISNHREVDTFDIIKQLWKLGKNVAVPKCNPKTRTMDFYVFTDFSQLETVYMDLKEPNPLNTTYVSPKDIDVIIVPGIVYDLQGYRVGYGGGYYDRYLTNYEGHLISLAFDFQIVETVPKESHDIPVDIIITDKNRIDCVYNRKEMAE